MFVSRRNRVEFIADFPEEDDAEIIASLEASAGNTNNYFPHGEAVITGDLRLSFMR